MCSPQNKLQAPVLSVTPETAAIRFDDVSFRYLNDQAILRGLSFSVQPGHKVALVGGSGSG